MHRLMYRSTGPGLAIFALLTHISVAVAHAGEAHPHVEASPWPIAGPIIALLVSGAAFWLTNRGSTRRPPAPPTGHPEPERRRLVRDLVHPDASAPRSRQISR